MIYLDINIAKVAMWLSGYPSGYRYISQDLRGYRYGQVCLQEVDICLSYGGKDRYTLECSIRVLHGFNSMS